MRILVTGASGFTGKYLCQMLKENQMEVFALSASLEQEEELQNELKNICPDVIVHLAAISYVGHEKKDEIYLVNTIGTFHLVRAVETCLPNIRCILVPSSANVYGDFQNDQNQNAENLESRIQIHEDMPFYPKNDYAVSKVSMEYMLRMRMNRLPITIVRPFNYTGVGQDIKFVIPKIVKHFQERRSFIELGNINVYREFNDVRFVAAVYLQLIKQNTVGVTLNVCTGVEHSLKDVMKLCSQITQHEMEIRIHPELVRENEVKCLVGDPRRLKETLVHCMPEYPFMETLSWMLSSS